MNRQKQYRIEHPEKVRSTRLKSRYGLSLEDWTELLLKQNGKCAICECELIGKIAHTDHDHETDAVRGILCNHCNRGLGGFRDDPKFLRKAIEYLRATSVVGVTVGSGGRL